MLSEHSRRAPVALVVLNFAEFFEKILLVELGIDLAAGTNARGPSCWTVFAIGLPILVLESSGGTLVAPWLPMLAHVEIVLARCIAIR